MIDYATYCEIRRLRTQKGLNSSQIAEELKLNSKTVEKWMKAESYHPRAKSKRTSKLDPFKGQVVAMLERHHYTAQQVFQLLRQENYQGGYSILKEFVRQVRPVKKEAFLNLAFAPGECAQIDWGQFGSIQVGSTRRRLSFFLMVLCHSRMMYVEFALSEAMEWFLSCQARAFVFFGGVPRKVMLDNLKAGVLSHPRGEKAVINPRYADFAAHYGFEPVACNVGRGNEKGRVENGIGYVKKNFLAGLEAPSFSALQGAASQWRDDVANVRLHGETNEKPLVLFEKEKPFLRPLPAMPYDCATIQSASVTRSCRIHFGGNRYSAPHQFASSRLTLKIYPDKLYLYQQETLVALHTRSYERQALILDPDHQAELLLERKRAQEQTLLHSFLSLSGQSQLFLEKLQQKRMNVPHHLRQIIALSQLHGREKTALAIADALHFEAIGSEYIANILIQKSQPPGEPGPLHLTHRQDLLELELQTPDLTPYQNKLNP